MECWNRASQPLRKLMEDKRTKISKTEKIKRCITNDSLRIERIIMHDMVCLYLKYVGSLARLYPVQDDHRVCQSFISLHVILKLQGTRRSCPNQVIKAFFSSNCHNIRPNKLLCQHPQLHRHHVILVMLLDARLLYSLIKRTPLISSLSVLHTSLLLLSAPPRW